MKAEDYFALMQYDQAIEWAGRSIAIGPNTPWTHAVLIAASALSGHETEAREGLQRYLALPPSGPRTIAAWKAYKARVTNEQGDPRFLEMWDRIIERAAGGVIAPATRRPRQGVWRLSPTAMPMVATAMIA